MTKQKQCDEVLNMADPKATILVRKKNLGIKKKSCSTTFHWFALNIKSQPFNIYIWQNLVVKASLIATGV